MLGKHFELKEELIGPPKLYFGGHISKVQLDNGVKCWSFSSSQYVQTAVKNVETHMVKINGARWQLPAMADTLLKASYHPELDVSPELYATNSAYYQSLIGVLRWIVELGCVDVCLEVLMMSSHITLPREGHLKPLLQIFTYLKKYHNTKMVYNPSQPEIDKAAFKRKTGHQVNLAIFKGERNCDQRCLNPVGLDSQWLPRLMRTMWLTQ